VSVCLSSIFSATQTLTPPTAVDMAMTPLNWISAANGIFNPVSASTVSTVHAIPP
jgi:hypothetical protein